MKKTKITLLAATLLMGGSLLAACSSDSDTSASSSADTTASTATTESTDDVVSTASISDQTSVIEKALSADGNWIVAVTDDMTFDADVTVDGEFHDKGDDASDIYRKFALYSQDDDRNVTAEYTVTVPKLVVNSENFNIVHGVIKGDIEVNANGFVLNGAKVEGNVTFTSQEFQDSATLDEEGASVTGDVTVSE
ncbi:polymer-forming cytoskeletal protein [Enterococcus sp.]|uniref:polymer-forming cytoskeletal protein n=1 Tax=Enterococcus sp. TaxID=35783 RepID=UPI00289EB2D6|nr:polymer-forming cytoskeletal protein [Enterococcus sp.]